MLFWIWQAQNEKIPEEFFHLQICAFGSNFAVTENIACINEIGVIF